ncbi:MAG TPA: acyl-CoA-binding protein [Wenzhouxiangella sp.]|nr:acyl-CoA-binding protein [Wenzhouxiangella sp.]
MTDLAERFEQAARDAHNLEDRPDNDTLLLLYAYFKQGREGDVSGERPGFFDFVGTAKYEAWEKLAGMEKSEARQKYVDLVESLKY